MSHPWLFSHAPSSMSTSSSSPTYLTTQREHSVHPAHLPAHSSGAVKNHSGVKTCRLAETRARQLPMVIIPKSLRPSQESKLILEIHVNFIMHRKNLEKKKIDLRAPHHRRSGKLEKLGRLACWILNYQRRPTCNRRCTSTIPCKALQSLISKMESYERC